MLNRSRRWLRQLAHNRSAIRRDIVLGLSHASSLPFTVFPLRHEPTVRSELDPRSYNSTGDMLNSLGQLIIPAQRDSASQGTLVVRPQRVTREEHSSRWFFINGMGTAPPVALLNASEIARIFQRPVHLIHTPTWGLARDVMQSVTARTLRKDGKLSRPAVYVVQEALEKHDRVVLFCHSQGTIVASYIVRKLLRHASTRDLVKKLELYCIGGVADSLEVDYELSRDAGHPVPYVEHFANGRDYFSETGVLSHLDSTAGTVFCVPERTGHLLNEHYLAGIARGDYCNRSSRLYRYVRGREPGEQDYMPIQPGEQL
ncbi:hypothetical protein [Alcanivorax sp. 1008]|uniref:hypothetical protein n=1 Tax=Alcanivorax sp. 1008 TaxID=2816853 RepID=UPI001D1D13B5|nr:hypothetical protein [Alcanivorax sp. 1008]MCC1497979.1 hypothetical protein [Alcanivorax sp. 1008]